MNFVFAEFLQSVEKQDFSFKDFIHGTTITGSWRWVNLQKAGTRPYCIPGVLWSVCLVGGCCCWVVRYVVHRIFMKPDY